MSDWRKALQSNAMRNLTLAILVANGVGIYAVEVRVNQPVAEGLDTEDVTPAPVLAEREIGAGLAALPSPSRTARAPVAAPAPQLAAAIAHFTSDAHFVPDARMQALAKEPSEPEFTAVVHDSGPGAVRVASVSPRTTAHDASASFITAFSGMSAAASTNSTDLTTSTTVLQVGASAPTGAETVTLDPTASLPPAIGTVPQGQDGAELPPVDDHAGATPAPTAPAPAASGADAPNTVLGA